MSPTVVADAVQLVTEVADAVAPALAPGVALTLGEPRRGPFELDLDYAVVAPLGGTSTGELALFVDNDFGRSLADSPDGGLDLAAALGPALESIAGVLGSVLLGQAVAVDARVAQSRVNALPDLAMLSLEDSGTVRAAVAVGLSPSAEDAPMGGGTPSSFGSRERLDLLRHVEMAATVELGRARMTINELLSLRNGAIIELDRAAGEAADLFVNGRLMARGEIVVVDENYALRITQIVTDEPGR